MGVRGHGMAEKHKTRLLLEFLFGENAETALRGASPGLLAWAEAFDEWMAEKGAKYTKSTTKQAKLAWRRLLGITRRDDSALGKRDHAFILARVRLGVPLKAIQRLRCVGMA